MVAYVSDLPASPLRRALVLGGLAVLGGCGGTPAPKVSPLRVQITADPSINPNADDDPSPTVVRIYELKSDTTFRQADFFALFDNDAQTLGADLISKREFELLPGAKQSYERDAPIETDFVGVIAGFRDINTAQWRAIAPVKRERVNDLIITVTALAVTITVAKTSRIGWF
jgi:type VI secretion system protein VasD